MTHLDDQTRKCGHCGGAAGMVICWDCAKLLRAYLAEVPWYVARLRESAYGEAKTSRPGLRVSTGERLPALPLNERAAGLLRDVNIRLGEMVRQVVADEHWDASNAARALQADIGKVMAYQYAADAVAWAIKWRSDAMQVIDLPPDMQYAGPCQHVGTKEIVNHGGEVQRTIPDDEPCGAALYVGADERIVTCPRCGTLWPVERLQRLALAQVDDSPRTAADMWRLLKLVGRDVKRSTFYKLMTRVEAHSMNGDTPLYTYTSVVAALDAQEHAAAVRAAKRERARAQKNADESTPAAVSC